MTTEIGTIWLRHGSNWQQYTDPQQIFQAHTIDQIKPMLQQIETAVNQQQLTAVGYLSYDAAAAFDPALTTHPPTELPLLWFGLYDQHTTHETLPTPTSSYEIGSWQANQTADQYAQAIAAVKEEITYGHTYQVNYTYRLRTDFAGDPFTFFSEIDKAQNGAYSAFLNLGRYTICSASPELFFTLDNQNLTSKPMKGTAKRGLRFEDDDRIGRWLQQDQKNRAENLMIVDMIRNDMSRVATPNSVKAPQLFEVTPYPTLWQMTSTVTCQTKPDTSLSDIFNALFPSASITGAPKVRTMKIINQLEPQPRTLYCGAIGFIAPDRQAQFNVAIRTTIIDSQTNRAEYGVGSGIVWDSDTADEYAECHTKATILTQKRPDFELLETILWEPDKDYFALKRHLGRMVSSADYFGYPIKVGEVIDLLYDHSDTFPPDEYRKARLLLNADGIPRIESTPFTPQPDKTWRLALASAPIDSQNIFLYHKTTHRAVYAPARAELATKNVDDLILWNENGELTETTIGNIALKINGRWLTPPLKSGLLGGVYRARLLALGSIQEKTLTHQDLVQASEIALINSVRKWCRATRI